MSPAHFDVLKTRVLAMREQIPTYAQHIRTNFASVGKTPSAAETRIMWDIFYATKIMNSYSYQEFDYKDTHIETAMRKILSEVSY